MFADHKSIVLHKKSDNSLKDTYFNRLSDKMNGYFTIHGTTLVNLLGSYGYFTGGSSPTGWVVTNVNCSTSDGEVTMVASGAGMLPHYLVKYITSHVIVEHTYFYSGEFSVTSGSGKLNFVYRDDSGGYINNLTDAYTSSTWGRISKKVFVESIYAAPSAVITVSCTNSIGNGTYEAAGETVAAKNILLIDLTAAGALDPVRQAKYGVANWSDLTEAQLEAEIPYFDSVLSVNVEDGTASELTVENRGKNLLKPTGKLYNSSYYLSPIPANIITNYDVLYCVHREGHSYWGTQINNVVLTNTRISWNDITGNTYAPGLIAKVKANTNYRISVSSVSDNLHSIRTTFFDVVGARISSIWTNSGAYNQTVTTPSNAAYILLVPFVHSGTTGNAFIENPQLEEGSVATDYVPPRTDSITIPDTCELHGYNGVFDSIEYEGDSVANYTQRWKREDKNTDGGGAFVLTDYKADTKIICRNKTTGEVKVLDADDSVDTDWNSITAEVLYILDEAVESIVDLTDNGYRLPKLMNQIVVDSNLPIAMLINDEESVGYLHTQNFLEE